MNKKVLNRPTPLSMVMTMILVINVIVVLYPVLFTISSSLTLSSSLAATSVIPFTKEKDVATDICNDCDGTGRKVESTKKIKVSELSTVLPDPSMAEKVLAALTVGDPFLGTDVATGEPFNPNIDHVGATVATIRVSTLFMQDDLKDTPEKCQNRDLIYTVYNNDGTDANSCVACKGKGKWACDFCFGKDESLHDKMGNAINKDRSTGVITHKLEADGTYEAEICPVCEGTGTKSHIRVAFKFEVPSLYQFRRLLTNADQEVPGSVANGGRKVLGTNYKHWYLNTLIIAVLNTVITVFICTTAGYIFSRFRFAGRRQIMAGMIILQMFPSFIGMVATYVILWKFNALNTLWGLVMVYAAGSIPFNSQLMKGYFDTMPRDIAEAAYIDGASPLSAYLLVILPAAKPQLVFLTLTSFTGPWMDYIFPRLILRSDDKKTLAVGLYEMISGRSNDNFTMFAAGAILVAVPFAMIFMAGQKSLLMSLAGTSGKE